MCWCNRSQTGTAALVRLFGQAGVHEIMPSQKKKHATRNSGEKLEKTPGSSVNLYATRLLHWWAATWRKWWHRLNLGKANDCSLSGLTTTVGNDQHSQGLWFLNQAVSHVFLNKAINHKQEQIFHHSAALPNEFKRKMCVVSTYLKFLKWI